MNAFDDGRHIHIDTPVGAKSAFPWFPDIAGAPFDPEASRGYLSRWTIDTMGESDGFSQERLTDCAGEFPRTDERRATRGYRFGVINLTDVPGRPPPPDGIPGFRWLAAIDPETSAMTMRYGGDDSTVQEAVFVPGSTDAAPGDGYLLQLVDRLAPATTDLLVLDAGRIDGEPVATVRVPIRMPGGLHGNWVTPEQLAGRAG
jgi:carotenoid cleavage dioxygenase